MSRTATLLALLLAQPLAPRGSAQDPEEPATIAVTATEVAVDFVVRDETGRLVLDLKREDVEVYHDGVLQEVELFQLVTRDVLDDAKPPAPEGPGGEPPPTAPAPRPPDVAQGAVVALVFDRLGPEARRTACDAATEWVKLRAVTSRRVGVFRIEQGLEMLQDFTDDRAAVREALDHVLTSQPMSYRSGYDRERLRTLRQEPASPMELSMLQATEALERDRQGLATTNTLLALVNGLRVVPGRKAVVFFSDGLVLPEREIDSLRTVISEANRGGVSFYSADAARTEDPARFDPATGLGTLARDTGGFLILDTRNISAGLRRVEEELGAYYLLSYAPANEEWDGGYRRIEIRVLRTGLEVQGRQGYFAVPTATPTPILEHEAPVLADLERTPAANEIPVRVSALQFPDQHGDSVVAMVADLPAGAASLRRAEGDDSTWTQDFTVLALVRNEAERIVHKSSRRYVLSWGEESLDNVQVGRVLFEREALLSPGRYTIEIVARDAQSGGMGVARLALELLPAGDDELRVSSLMVVGHAEPHATGDASPLVYEGVQLYPNLGDPVSRDQGLPLTFLFTLRPGARALAAATVELLQGDTSILQSSIALPAPDPSGQMRVVSGLKLDALEPGPYVLRLRVTNAQGFQTRSTPFTLGP